MQLGKICIVSTTTNLASNIFLKEWKSNPKETDKTAKRISKLYTIMSAPPSSPQKSSFEVAKRYMFYRRFQFTWISSYFKENWEYETKKRTMWKRKRENVGVCRKNWGNKRDHFHHTLPSRSGSFDSFFQIDTVS